MSIDPSRPSPGGRRRLMLLAGLVIIALMIIGAMFLLPPSSPPRRSAMGHIGNCQSNLRQIGLAFDLYRYVNRGKFPPGGNDVLLNHLFTGDSPVLGKEFGLVQCASTNSDRAETAPIAPEHIDFLLKAGGSATTSALDGLGPDEPIAIDNPDNHGKEADGASANVLFMDFHAETIYDDPEMIAQFRKRILTPGPTGK